MPSLGADMQSGRLLEWLVEPGQRVARGDIVAVVDTDKAEIEIETFDDGVVGELLIEPGTDVPVGTPLATILSPSPEGRASVSPGDPRENGRSAVGDPAATAPPPPPPTPPSAPPPAPAPKSAPPAPAPTSAPPAPEPTSGPPALHVWDDGRVHATPLARRVAAEIGVDLHALQGTGPHGAIVRADVEHAAPPQPAASVAPPSAAPSSATAAPPSAAPQATAAATTAPPAAAASAPAPDASDRHAAMRAAIGALMARSAREIPHYHLGHHVDVGAALTFTAAHNAGLPVAKRLVPAALLLKATALAAREAPALNGHWHDDGLRGSDRVHLGVAIALRGGGLIAPAIHDADTLSLDDLMAALLDLVERARRGRLRNSEMNDATITVTNLGDRGVETVHGVIYPPQVALVGFGAVVQRPWAVDGLLGVRPIVHATLAADHRASDGHTGGLFLAAIDHHLQEADQL